MEKIIYITEEIAKTLPAHTLVTVEKSTPTVTRIAGESITWLTDKQVTELEEKLGYVFRNKTLLTQAFTHSSCRPSHSEGDAMDNETLEFIGDRSLDLIITKKLISHYGKQQYTEEEAKQNLNGFNPLSVKLNEGELTLLKTQLVNTEALSEQASKLGLQNYLITGDTDREGMLKEEKSVREDLFEATIGAVTVDSGWNMPEVEAVLDRIYNITTTLNHLPENTNYVGLLQEYLQMNYGIMPDYEITEEEDYGPYHFMCTLRLPRRIFPDKLPDGANDDDENIAILGSGYTKQEARMNAAESAYDTLIKEVSVVDAMINAVGKPTPERAVNQLQELWQKHLIGCPEYTFGHTSEFWEAEWECTCQIEGKGTYTVISSNKANAKKHVAYLALCSIFGIEVSGDKVETREMLEYKASMEELNADRNAVLQEMVREQNELEKLKIKLWECRENESEEAQAQIEELEKSIDSKEANLQSLRNELCEIEEVKRDLKIDLSVDDETEEDISEDDEFTAAVGEPDLDRAVNQLQELWQKGFIAQPEYTCTETVTDVSVWTFTCRIPEDGVEAIGIAPTKQAAKKQAAYNAYCTLIGR